MTIRESLRADTSPESRLSRRDFLAAAGAVAGTLLTRNLRAAEAGRRPNFVFILSDDQNWNGLSVQMHDGIPASKSDFYCTPNLERLASQGMRFAAAYAPAPVCSPTRCSLQTGKSPAQLHWTKAAPVMTREDGYGLIPPRIERSLPSREVTIAEMLKRTGYATAHFGKWHLRGGGPGRHGYDVHDGDTSNRDAAGSGDPNPADIFGITRRCNTFMQRHVEAGTPFYVQLSHHALHCPEQSLRSTQTKYEQRPRGRMHHRVEIAAMTEDLDTSVGLVLDQIAQLGIAENTYVIYMSDNGAGGRGGPVSGGKGSLWEGGIRVPLIIRGPGVRPGACCPTRVVGFDLFPTFCELAGIREPLPDEIEGGSIVGLFASGKGEVKRPREEVVFHFPHYQARNGPHSAILFGEHKLIRFYETNEVRLFDLSHDLGETRDLAKKVPQKAAQLGARLSQYLRDIGAQMPKPNPECDPKRPPVGSRRRKTGRRGRRGPWWCAQGARGR